MTAADAVTGAQFTIGAALAGFLLLASAVGVLVVAVGWRVIRWAANRYRQADARQAAFLAETLTEPEPEPEPVRAVLDTEPGINLAWRDECELLYSMPTHQPAHPEPADGIDRLLAAIRDDQTGEATDA